MLSVNRMYNLISLMSKTLAVSPKELMAELHDKPVSIHSEEFYPELHTLYNSYHTHLENIDLSNARKTVPDEADWLRFCNTYYNWIIDGREYCFRIADTKTCIKIGKVYVPAYTVTCMNNNRVFLIAPRVFPYIFVFAKKYERSYDANAKEITLRIQEKDRHVKVIQVSRTGEEYFSQCFGLQYDVFIKYLAESLYRTRYMRTYQHNGSMLDLTQLDGEHRSVSPHFRNGFVRTCSSGKQVYVRPTYVHPNSI